MPHARSDVHIAGLHCSPPVVARRLAAKASPPGVFHRRHRRRRCTAGTAGATRRGTTAVPSRPVDVPLEPASTPSRASLRKVGLLQPMHRHSPPRQSSRALRLVTQYSISDRRAITPRFPDASRRRSASHQHESWCGLARSDPPEAFRLPLAVTARAIRRPRRPRPCAAGSKPVEVFTKSARARTAARAACSSWSPSRYAVSTMTLRTRPGTALRTAWISASTASKSPPRASPMAMTMSTSSAPSSAACRASAALMEGEFAPSGNATTVTTRVPVPVTVRRASGTKRGWMHTPKRP